MKENNDFLLEKGLDSQDYKIIHEISFGGIPTINNHILMSSKKKGEKSSFELAKGHLKIKNNNFPESPLECSLREVSEELLIPKNRLTFNGYENYLHQELVFNKSKEHCYKLVCFKGLNLDSNSNCEVESESEIIRLISLSEVHKYANEELLPILGSYKNFVIRNKIP